MYQQNNYLLNVTQVDQLKKRCKVETRKWKTGQKIGHYANLHFIYERETERERRAGFSHLQEDYAMPKLQIIAAMYVVCVSVTVRMRNVRKRKRWRWPSLVRQQRFEFHEKKLNYNLSLGVFVWAVCQWKFFSCWLVAFFRNSVRFSMGYSKDLCVLKESVWKWKWFAINKLKYQRDDNSNSSSRRIIII